MSNKVDNKNIDAASNENAMQVDKFRELAERIYELDKDVYVELGSSLGRVFHGDREKCIRDLMNVLVPEEGSHAVRSELALISNMARSIQDRDVRRRIMKEYNDIIKNIQDIPTSFARGDIIDPNIAKLNMSNLDNRFGKSDHLVVCIGRSYGCAGNDIGFALADKLRINFYDVSIVKEVIGRMSDDNGDEHINFEDDNKWSISQWCKDFVTYHGLPRKDVEFFKSSQMLVDLARKEDFVVMGRYADVVLTNNHIPHISIFITAPFELRVRRIHEINEGKMTLKQARKLVAKEDAKHMERYQFYTGHMWGKASNYDLTVNSASYGIQGSVDLIMRMMDKYDRK